MSKPLGAMTYIIDVEEFATPSADGQLRTQVGYLFVTTDAQGNQEQRWVLLGWNSHKFLTPPRRSAGMRLTPSTLGYTSSGGVHKTVVDLATWVEFSNTVFDTSTSAYAKVATRLKAYRDFSTLPASFSTADYPPYMSPTPPTSTVLPQQIDIGALILRLKGQNDQWWAVGFAHGSPDGTNKSREHWILLPDGTNGAPALTHGLTWPHSGELRIGGTDLNLAELSSLMNLQPWQNGSTLVLASCTYYNYVADS